MNWGTNVFLTFTNLLPDLHMISYCNNWLTRRSDVLLHRDRYNWRGSHYKNGFIFCRLFTVGNLSPAPRKRSFSHHGSPFRYIPMLELRNFITNITRYYSTIST